MENKSSTKVLSLGKLSEREIYQVVKIHQDSCCQQSDYNYLVLVKNTDGFEFNMYMSFYDIQLAMPGEKFTVEVRCDGSCKCCDTSSREIVWVEL